MDANIYYIKNNHTLFITSTFAEIQRNMDLGINPQLEYLKIEISDVANYIIKAIGFDKVDDLYFQSIKDIFANNRYEGVAFHNCAINLTGICIDTEHLVVGDSCKINFTKENFKNLKEITFLSMKSYKGRIIYNISYVKKITAWYVGLKSELVLSLMPNLEELVINHGSMTTLDLLANPKLRVVGLHYCRKLEKVVINSEQKIEKVVVENCKNLDINNLGPNIFKF